MNNHATIEKMQEMRLYGMLKAFQTTMETISQTDFTPDEMLAHLVEAEWDERFNRKLTRLLTNAKFRYQASLEQIDFKTSRGLDKNKILRLSNCNWINKGEDIIITGPTGIGKSFLACSIGQKACVNGYKTGYYNCLKLFSNLKFGKAAGTYIREIDKIKKQDLIILDDFGLQVMDSQERLIMLEIIEDRHGKKGTIIISQVPVKNWFDIIGDHTIADAICDRIIHNSFKINLKGESMRKIISNNSRLNLPPEK